MRRLSFSLAVVALVLAPAALADGPPPVVTQGGTGVASHTNAGIHYVAVSDRTGGTLLEAVDARSGGVSWWGGLKGSWGIPTVGFSDPVGQGLSQNGRTLVLGSTDGPYASPSKFLVVDPTRMRALRTIVLRGSFSFDALSPDASKLYLIQYRKSGDLTHYVVRAYDLRTSRLLPGRIADKAEHEESMAGLPITRTTSADGRWVYTLYQKPSGEPFVHALDTVGAAAYCIDLPENRDLYSIVLSLRDHDRTLALNGRKGRLWLSVATGSWRISHPKLAASTPSSGVPWAWAGAALGGLVLLAAAGALLVRRRRGKNVEQHARKELGLA